MKMQYQFCSTKYDSTVNGTTFYQGFSNVSTPAYEFNRRDIILRDDINRNMTASRMSVDSISTVIMPDGQSALKRLLCIFYEAGYERALDEAENLQMPAIVNVAKFLKGCLNTIKLTKKKLGLELNNGGIDYLSNFTAAVDWKNAFIRVISWHPNFNRFAVAGRDDIVRIYKGDKLFTSLLKNDKQKYITCIAWRPYEPTQLVVGCMNGFILWTINHGLNDNITRPALQSEVFNDLAPIVAVEWNADGSLLATSTYKSSNIIVWCVDTRQKYYMPRTAPGCSILKWSKRSTFLFGATTSSVFRLWRTYNHFEQQRWILNKGTIRSACWSPCESYILYINTVESIIYRLQLNNEVMISLTKLTHLAAPILDVGECSIDNHQITGKPYALDIDPTGKYLAVMYLNSPFVVIFKISIIKSNVCLMPFTYYVGDSMCDEEASYICFESQHVKTQDAVLAIAWNSGRIEFQLIKNI